MAGMTFKLKIWRQEQGKKDGKFVDYTVKEILPEMSFLEMLDVLNEQLAEENKDPVAFDSDCREGICGMCGLVINGLSHGPKSGCTTCELRMREFSDGETIVIEPWRAKAFPILKDLVVDRTAFDRIQQAGGYVSVNTGGAADANAIPVGKQIADEAMDYATCIGCGACVAACPNASASLFVGAKVSQYALMPQGHAESTLRVNAMVDQMDLEGFGDCSNYAECEAVCPKNISIEAIAKMRQEYVKANL